MTITGKLRQADLDSRKGRITAGLSTIHVRFDERVPAGKITNAIRTQGNRDFIGEWDSDGYFVVEAIEAPFDDDQPTPEDLAGYLTACKFLVAPLAFAAKEVIVSGSFCCTAPGHLVRECPEDMAIWRMTRSVPRGAVLFIGCDGSLHWPTKQSKSSEDSCAQWGLFEVAKPIANPHHLRFV